MGILRWITDLTDLPIGVWIGAAFVSIWGAIYALSGGAVCSVTWYDMTGNFEAVCILTELASKPPPCQGPGC